MSSLQADPTVVIANGYARLEERVTAWVEDDPGVRAAVVIASRARTEHPADEWADLDVVVITSDIGRLIPERTWLARVGEQRIAFLGQVPVGRSCRARSGRPEASMTRWNVSAGTRRHEI